MRKPPNKHSAHGKQGIINDIAVHVIAPEYFNGIFITLVMLTLSMRGCAKTEKEAIYYRERFGRESF